MPRIPYVACRFDAYPPTRKLDPKKKGKRKAGALVVSLNDLANYAMSVGDPAVFSNSRSRPWFELIWRASLLLSSLEESNDCFVRSSSYERLDPSEKSAVSYFLGMTQCATMADRILGVTTTVHVDSLLHLLGKSLPKISRPDLVGYSNPPSNTSIPGRFLLEAKGRSHGFSQKVVDSALHQLEQPPGEVVRLVSPQVISVASLAYFEPIGRGGAEIWHGYLVDPPLLDETNSSEFGDEEYCGLIVISQLLPVYRAISSLGELSDHFTATERDGLMTVRLPIEGASVGIPTEMYKLLAKVDSPLRERRQREIIARSAWELTNSATYATQFADHTFPGEHLSVLSSGLSFLVTEPAVDNMR